jgi:nickel-dependent lactate racemase
VNLGTTSSGTPVEINSEYLKSDIKILFTDITLHYFAGFGGDRKSIHPGLASKRTTNQNHSMVIKGLSAPGKLKNNPIHEDMLEAAKMAGADFVINMCFNSSNELFSVYSGSLNSAFEKACSDYLQRYAVSIKAQADLLIISPGGSPYDINLYQSQKALMQCSKCVKEGAPIIFMNEAAGGIGNSVFEQWNEKYRIKDEIIRAIETHFEQGANNVLNQRNFTERNKIYIYTSLPGGIVSAFGMEKIDDLNEIVHKLTQNTSLIYIIKNGSKMMINRN